MAQGTLRRKVLCRSANKSP